MAKRFLKPVKQVKKEIGGKALNSAVSGGGFLAGKGLGNYVASKIKDKADPADATKIVPNKLKKIIGPAQFILGTVAEAFIEQPQVAAIGRGIAVAGVERTFGDWAPDKVKTTLHLSGLGATNSVNDGAAFDWEAAARKYEAEAAQRGEQPADAAAPNSMDHAANMVL